MIMTSKALRLAGVAILVSGLVVGTPAMAQHGHGGHGGGHGGGWGWGLFGLGLGLALSAPYYYPYYGAPYYPPAYYPPYQPSVVIREPVYVYPDSPQYVPQASAPEAVHWWYYCPKSRGYYPYVRTCPGGWEKVSPTPP